MTFVKDLNGRRFAASIADSKAKRVWNNRLNRYEMSWMAGITEKDAPNKDATVYVRHKLGAVEAQRVREFLATTTPFTKPIKRGVYTTCEPKPHFRNHLTGTGSKSAPQAPVWGYKLIKTTAPGKRVDRYVGIDYGYGLDLPAYLNGNEYTPAVPQRIEVSKFLPCGLADQKLLFVPRHAKRHMNKNSALDRVFVSREWYPKELIKNPLPLESQVDGEESTWVPVSDDPIELMSRNEQYSIRQRNAQTKLDEIKALLGDSKYELLIMSAQGMNAAEIAERTGGSQQAIKKSLQRIKKLIKEAN